MRNRIILKKQSLIKVFNDKLCFERELKANQIFKQAVKTPRIITFNKNNLSIEYEFIKGTNKISFKCFKGLIQKIEIIKSNNNIFDWSSSLENLILSNYDNSFLNLIDFSKKTLIHGDLRPYNIIYNNEIYLIDFEFSRNYIIEYDIAKFYIESLALHKKISDDIIGFAEEKNYYNFLHSCLLIGYQQLYNSPYDKRLIKKFINEVNNEINLIVRK